MNQSRLTILELSQLQAKDPAASVRHRGVPMILRHAPAWFLALTADEVTPEVFERVLQYYRTTHRPKDTGLNLVVECNSLMNWAMKAGHRSAPFSPLRYPQRMRLDAQCLTPAERAQVIATSDRIYPGDLVVAIAIRALAWLGLPVTAAANFSLKQINFQTWEYEMGGDRNRYRCIPIPTPMRALIAKARHVAPNGGSHPRERWVWLSDQTLRNYVRRVGREVGRPQLTPIHLVRTALNHALSAEELLHLGLSGEVQVREPMEQPSPKTRPDL